MKIINNQNTNPYFNLATEEYLLKNFSDNVFMLWRNESCIVVGKNQNTLSQINYQYIKDHNIPVVRRLSGGGAVFHDLGNINFTFICENNDSLNNNFKKYTKPIVDLLWTIGIIAKFTGRNDLTIDSKKFSGNAQYYYKNKVLHHGTLLFSSNITDLSSALKVTPSKFQDKGVKSISARVTNISEHLKKPLSVEEFENLLINYELKINSEDNLYNLNDNDVKNINLLVKEKYNTYEWNFGNSPNYTYHSEKRFSGGSIECNISIGKGKINDIKIYGDFFNKKPVRDIENALLGIEYSEDIVKLSLTKFIIDDYFSNINLSELLQIIF